MTLYKSIAICSSYFRQLERNEKLPPKRVTSPPVHTCSNGAKKQMLGKRFTLFACRANDGNPELLPRHRTQCNLLSQILASLPRPPSGWILLCAHRCPTCIISSLYRLSTFFSATFLGVTQRLFYARQSRIVGCLLHIYWRCSECDGLSANPSFASYIG